MSAKRYESGQGSDGNSGSCFVDPLVSRFPVGQYFLLDLGGGIYAATHPIDTGKVVCIVTRTFPLGFDYRRLNSVVGGTIMVAERCQPISRDEAIDLLFSANDRTLATQPAKTDSDSK
jgi:hypothetical protein